MDITVKIAGTDYKLKADSPESEQFTRLAADEINGMLAKYDARFTDRTLSDKLVFVALLETKVKLQYAARMNEIVKETRLLKEETDSYLENLK